MAIPQGRLSTVLVDNPWLTPEDRLLSPPQLDYEIGPKAVNDTSEGLLYQVWTSDWDSGTGDITLTPEDFGSPVVVGTVPDLIYFRFTFDQSGRVTYSYMNGTSSYLYWYDTGLPGQTTTDLGATAITPTIYLDDKRETQDANNDMLLFYTKDTGGGNYNLYMKVQRERYITEHDLGSVPRPYIYNVGQTGGLRIKLGLGLVAPS